jgi:hypothetical protein
MKNRPYGPTKGGRNRRFAFAVWNSTKSILCLLSYTIEQDDGGWSDAVGATGVR